MENGTNVIGPEGGPGGSYEEQLLPGPWLKAGAGAQEEWDAQMEGLPYLEGGLTEIIVNGGDWINGVQFTDSKGYTVIAGNMTSGTLGTLSLNPRGIDTIAVTSGDYVNGLTFNMMDGTQHVIAGSKSAPNTVTLSVRGWRIVGLACRSGTYVDAFGIISTPM